jgi:hypothetical protein
MNIVRFLLANLNEEKLRTKMRSTAQPYRHPGHLRRSCSPLPAAIF